MNRITEVIIRDEYLYIESVTMYTTHDVPTTDILHLRNHWLKFNTRMSSRNGEIQKIYCLSIDKDIYELDKEKYEKLKEQIEKWMIGE